MDATAKEQAPQNIDLCIQLRKVGIGRFQQLLLSNTATKTAEEDINTIKLKSAETLAKEHKIKQPIDKELGNRIKLLYDLLGANLLGKDYYIYRKSMHPAILAAVKRTCNPETQIQNTRQHTLTDFLNPTSIKTKKLKRKEREQPTNQSGRIREWNLSNENERKRMIVTTVCGPKRRAKV
jgi:ribonuclease HI